MDIRTIYDFLDKLAPFDTACDFDNCGLLIGSMDTPVQKIGLALDATHAVIDNAIEQGINLLITHHPVIFHPLKRIEAHSVVYRLIQNDIAVISAHTNLDKAEQGVNAQLASYYGLHNVTAPLAFEQLGRVGELEEALSVPAYAEQVKRALDCEAVRYYDAGAPVKRVAYASGSGGSLLREVLACGADTFITGDVKHDVFVDAQNAGLNLLDVGHFDSENIVLQPLKTMLKPICGQTDVVVLSTENPVHTL